MRGKQPPGHGVAFSPRRCQLDGRPALVRPLDAIVQFQFSLFDEIRARGINGAVVSGAKRRAVSRFRTYPNGKLMQSLSNPECYWHDCMAPVDRDHLVST